jgi:integrase
VASIQERKGVYRVIFRHEGKQYFVPIGKVGEQEAQAKAAHVDYLLLRLKQGLIELPEGVGVVEFIQFDGKPPAKGVAKPVAKRATLASLRDEFAAARAGAREASTQKTTAVHFRHLARTLGENFPLTTLKLGDLQRHVNRRAKAKVSAETIRKEITTLRTAWSWAVLGGLLAGDYPNKGLHYPKDDELPPFQTREEIERKAAAGGMSEDELDAAWKALYLRPDETAEVLELVKANALYPWIYPLVCVAAHTGARRSELVRMTVSDVDLAGGAITFREKKRVKGKRSTRRSPMTNTLRAALAEWLAQHPGGSHLFCQSGFVPHSKKRSRTTGHQNGEGRPTTDKERMASVKTRRVPLPPTPLTVNELRDHFNRTLAGTKWSVVKGLHVFRHSVASCLAAAGVDQRVIDDMLGHVSEEMRRRYRHLTPQFKTQAVSAVYD